MKAITTGGGWIPSKHGNRDIFQMFLRLDNGKSARTYIDPQNKNSKRWKEIVSRVDNGKEVEIQGVIMKRNDLVNADSFVEIIEPESEVKTK